MRSQVTWAQTFDLVAHAQIGRDVIALSYSALTETDVSSETSAFLEMPKTIEGADIEAKKIP